MTFFSYSFKWLLNKLIHFEEAENYLIIWRKTDYMWDWNAKLMITV